MDRHSFIAPKAITVFPEGGGGFFALFLGCCQSTVSFLWKLWISFQLSNWLSVVLEFNLFQSNPKSCMLFTVEKLSFYVALQQRQQLVACDCGLFERRIQLLDTAMVLMGQRKTSVTGNLDESIISPRQTNTDRPRLQGNAANVNEQTEKRLLGKLGPHHLQAG